MQAAYSLLRRFSLCQGMFRWMRALRAETPMMDGYGQCASNSPLCAQPPRQMF